MIPRPACYSLHMLKLVAGLAVVALPFTALADEKYREPPPAIRAVLRAPWIPVTHVSPNGKYMVAGVPNLYPPISELAAPMYRLAGVRVNPRANDVHVPGHYNGVFTLRQLPDGKDVAIKMPKDLRPSGVLWNADGSRFAFVDHGERAVELWIVDTTAAEAKKVGSLALDPILGSTLQWMPDGKTLLVKAIPEGRGAPPPEAPPTGPDVQDPTGVTKPSSTYEARDLLRTPHDADLFEYYATSQLALVDATTLAVKRIGKPAVFGALDVAPDGAHLLVMRVLRPYVYTRPWRRFAREIEVWDRDGKKLETIAKLPVADQVPIDGVETGPRTVQFVPTAPATVFWVEALDQGDWAVKAKHRDRLVRKPIGKPATTWLELEQRFEGVDWLATGEQALVTDFERDRRWTRTFLVPAESGTPQKLVWDRSVNDSYGDPGSPVYIELASGVSAVRVDNGAIWLAGVGATAQGARPFLDRLELATLKTERLFRADTASLESFRAWLDPSKGTFFTEKQSPTLPPNLALRTLGAAVAKPAAGDAARTSELRMLTKFTDPTPSVRGITKRLVTTKRADGTQLSFTLYLPPGYKTGTRLPTVFWAYPLEYSDPTTAGQVNAAPNEFTAPIGAAFELFALQGYAVLDVAMPVVGPPETVYDTF